MRPIHERYDKETIDAVIDAFTDSKKSLMSIAKEFGVTYSGVRRILIESGIDPGSNVQYDDRRRGEKGRQGIKELSPQQMIIVKSMARDGASYKEIGFCLGVGFRRLRREMQKEGIQPGPGKKTRRCAPPRTKGVTNALTSEQWSYIAGLFEARGSVSTVDDYREKIRITIPSASIADWLQTILGIGTIKHFEHRSEFLITGKKDVHDVAVGIEPYLVSQKSRVRRLVERTRELHDPG